jgi:tight adherence protein B
MATTTEHVASTAHRLAVMLAAGVSPTSAWGYLTENDDDIESAEPGRGSVSADDIATQIDNRGSDWSGLAVAWRIATEAGAPLAPALLRYADSLRALTEAEREARIALAGPQASSRLVLALPPVGIVFGGILGFDTLGTLCTTTPGVVCLVVGAALIAAGASWTRTLVKAAEPRDRAPGLAFDLMAIAMAGGTSLDRARALVAPHVSTMAAVDAVLDLSRRAGVPAASLLVAEAEESRREAIAAAKTAASHLGVRLMLPLGICVLPAFMLLAVAPLLIAVISSTIGDLAPLSP